MWETPKCGGEISLISFISLPLIVPANILPNHLMPVRPIV